MFPIALAKLIIVYTDAGGDDRCGNVYVTQDYTSTILC
jgi:hypothetical protein